MAAVETQEPSLSTTPTLKQGVLERSAALARRTRNLDALFAPRTVAVVGATVDPASVGGAVFRNLLFGGFTGRLYPVNPKRDSVLGVRSFATLVDIGETIDLCVLVIPASSVLDVLEDCVRVRARAVILISAGFKETGPAGAELERRVRERIDTAGMVLLGPNCLGLINTDPGVSLNATFARSGAHPGSIAFLSQSGALGTAILDYARQNNIGFSRFVSFGNRADVTENDLLRYFASDPLTRVILMYVEDLADGQSFIRICREITGESETPRPILAMKSGRTAAGAGASASHTGALAGSDEAYQAIFAQAGVLRVDTVRELFDYAQGFASAPLPKGERVAILTNAGGPGILATDACVRSGLDPVRLQAATQERLASVLPASAGRRNPVDILGDARAERYSAAMEILLSDPDSDALLVILTPQNMTDIAPVAEMVVRAQRGTDKTVLASFMGGVDVAVGVDILRKGGVAHYAFPEEAVRVLSAMRTHARWLGRERTTERIFEVDRKVVHEIVAQAQAAGRRALPEYEALAVLRAYGFRTPRFGVASTAGEAVALAESLGFPVVVKIASPDILHKSDVGGVATGLADANDVRVAFTEVVERAQQARPTAQIVGATVMEMARAGRELILGVARDPSFGPLVMFGLGGIYAEVLKDVTFRLAPLRTLSARHMLEEIRGSRILTGVRGQEPVDLPALQECIERLSQLAIEFPLIQELDVNPLVAYADGALALDARILLAPAGGRNDS